MTELRNSAAGLCACQVCNEAGCALPRWASLRVVNASKTSRGPRCRASTCSMFELSVTGPTGCNASDASDTVDLWVNLAPLAVLPDATYLLSDAQPAPVLDAGLSYDPDGEVVSATWRLGRAARRDDQAAGLAARGAGRRRPRLRPPAIKPDRQSSSQMVTVRGLRAAFLAPALPLAAPCVLGNCFPHALSAGRDALLGRERASQQAGRGAALGRAAAGAGRRRGTSAARAPRAAADGRAAPWSRAVQSSAAPTERPPLPSRAAPARLAS